MTSLPVSYTHLDVYKRQVLDNAQKVLGIEIAAAAQAIWLRQEMGETSQEVIKFINEVVSDNSSQINPPAADGSSEVNDLLNKLEEQVCYGQMTAEDAGQQLFTEGSKIMESKKN